DPLSAAAGTWDPEDLLLPSVARSTDQAAQDRSRHHPRGISETINGDRSGSRTEEVIAKTFSTMGGESEQDPVGGEEQALMHSKNPTIRGGGSGGPQQGALQTLSGGPCLSLYHQRHLL